MSDAPKPPSGLKTAGKGLWNEIAGHFGLRIDEEAFLVQACKTLDLIVAMEREIGGELVSVGSKGQPVAHPLLGELQRSRALLARLLSMIDIPTGDITSKQAREAAQARWNRRKQLKEARSGMA